MNRIGCHSVLCFFYFQGFYPRISIEEDHQEYAADYPGNRLAEGNTNIPEAWCHPQSCYDLKTQLQKTGHQRHGLITDALHGIAVNKDRSQEEEEGKMGSQIQRSFL